MKESGTDTPDAIPILYRHDNGDKTTCRYILKSAGFVIPPGIGDERIEEISNFLLDVLELEDHTINSTTGVPIMPHLV